MKKPFFYLLFSVIFSLCGKSQNNLNKLKAEKSVSLYMVDKFKNYKSLTFGEFFEQSNPTNIQEKLATKKIIKYSLIHTYKVGDEQITNTYFHLDDKYNVIGKLTYKEMEAIMLKENKNALDSIMNSLVPSN